MIKKQNEEYCIFQGGVTLSEVENIIHEVKLPKLLVEAMDKRFTRKTSTLGWWCSYPAPTPLMVDISIWFDKENEPMFNAKIQHVADAYTRVKIFEVCSSSLLLVVREVLRKCSEEIAQQTDNIQKFIEEDELAITEYNTTKGETNHEN